MEWDGHLVIFSCPRVMENSRQYLVLRTDILRKTVVGCRDNISVIFADTAFKLEKVGPVFSKFHYTSILVIHSNRRQETGSMPKYTILKIAKLDHYLGNQF